MLIFFHETVHLLMNLYEYYKAFGSIIQEKVREYKISHKMFHVKHLKNIFLRSVFKKYIKLMFHVKHWYGNQMGKVL